jgi:hypothetical protein
MPAYSPYSVELLFIRNGGGGSSTDDKMRIRKNFETGEFELVYTDSHNHPNKLMHTLNGLYRQRVIDHVYLTLKNLSIDEDTFYQLQLNLPGMPAVLVSVENLSDVYYRDHFLELVENGLDNLDVLERVVKPHVAAAVEDQDEYADMPPLISFAELKALKQAQQQNANRILSPSMDHFLDTNIRHTLHPKVVEQRRSARLAERCNQPCGGGGCTAPCNGPRRDLYFNQDDEDDHEDY